MNSIALRTFLGKFRTSATTQLGKSNGKSASSGAPISRSANRWVRQYSTKHTTSIHSSTHNPLKRMSLMPSGALPTSFARSHSRLITRPNGGPLVRLSRRTIFIKTESTPNPDSMKFIPDKQLLEQGQSIDFENAMAAARSPLAKMLFRNENVKRVFIGHSFVTVTKDEEVEWDEVKPSIFADLMEFLSGGEEVLLGEAPVSDTSILPDDDEDVALIKTLLETRIRPSIQDDGGDLTYKGFIDGVVFLQLQGIEKMLKHWSSAVISVVAVESEEEWERIRSGQPQLDSQTSSSSSHGAPPSHNLSEAELNSTNSKGTAPKLEEL